MEAALDVFNNFVDAVLVGGNRPGYSEYSQAAASGKPAVVDIKPSFFGAGLGSVSGDDDSERGEERVIKMMSAFENLLKQQADQISSLTLEVSRLKVLDNSIKLEDLSDKINGTQSKVAHLDRKFNDNISTLREVPALRTRVDVLSNSGVNNSSDKEEILVLRKEMDTLHYEMDVLDRRSQSDFLDFDDIHLPSLRDTFLWVNDHVESSSYCCFYDFISLLDSIGNATVEDSAFVRSEHDAMKAKFINTAEVSISASFRHVAPMAFSRKEQDDVGALGSIEQALPRVKKRDYWVSMGGRHGLKRSLSKDVEGQVSSIRKLIKGTLVAEGAILANMFLDKTLECWRTFMSWTEDFYQELIGTSAVEPKEAWNLILQCWMGFFEDIRDIRRDVSALKASGLEVGSTARKELVGHYVWTTGRVIKLQEEYCAKNFRNHPTIAGVINYHLFEHRLPTSVHDSHVKRFERFEKEFNNFKAETTRKLKKVD
jgi:hypothetical protein